MTSQSTKLPFTIVFADSSDLTDWDTLGEEPDPIRRGWKIEPMGGVTFRVTSPAGEQYDVDGVIGGRNDENRRV